MKAVTAERMKQLDNMAISCGISGETLMDKAGYAVAEVCNLISKITECNKFVIFAGKGNNGGDAFAAARYLKHKGYDITVILGGSASNLKGDALIHFKKLEKISLIEAENTDIEKSLPQENFIIVDGLLGTGFKGRPYKPVDSLIRLINRISERRTVVSIDLPSGLDADTGKFHEDLIVRADITVTIGLPKVGLLSKEAINYTGTIFVADIGIPDTPIESEIEMIDFRDFISKFSKRARNTHKGDYGHLLLIAGSKGFLGACILAAKAALRSGVGLVSIITPINVWHQVSTSLPEAMVHPVPVSQDGTITAEGAINALNRIKQPSCIAIGPGTGVSNEVIKFLEFIFTKNIPIVLDADAINSLARKPEIIKNAKPSIVVTPHPGEMARFMNCTVSEIQENRIKYACKLSELYGINVVLKGAYTVVKLPKLIPAINPTGNAGMATGGAGDILTGLLSGYLTQRWELKEAIFASVYLHGLAGDIASLKYSQYCISSTELIKYLPLSLKFVYILSTSLIPNR